MTYPRIELGGIPLDIRAGEVVETDSPITASVIVRMGLGSGIQLTHWSRAAGSLRGSGGWIPPGLDGLDFSQPLELKLTNPESITGPGPVFTLHSDARADKAPWAYAEVQGEWVPVACVASGRSVSVAVVPGAVRYRVHWMPCYRVFAKKPPRDRSRSFDWTIEWEQI